MIYIFMIGWHWHGSLDLDGLWDIQVTAETE